MSRRIKGITIEIDGETRGLDKALRDVSQRSREITNELRDVDRLLKFNPGNVELVAQKQKLLAEQVKVTRERLDRLKASQDQVTEAFKRGEISEEQYRAFQREIIETESKLKHFEKQLEQSQTKLDKFADTAKKAGEKLKSVGDKITSVGKNLSMKVTTPIAGLGTAIAKTGMDFEAAMSEVAAISGATGDDLAALEAKAKEMGATTKFSASEAAEALKYMAMAGWDTQKMLDGLPGVMSLAAASGEDLATVSDILTDVMTAFGMEASQAAQFADILAAASSSANTNVGMMGETFKYVAPVFGSLGYTAEDAALAIGLMANAGIKASQAGTALRGAITRMVKPTSSAAAIMEELGIKVTDAQGNMLPFREVMDQLRAAFSKLTAEQQAQYASIIFGQEAMSGMLAIINASEEDYQKLATAIDNSNGAAERMAEQMQDNLKGRLTELRSAIEGVALQLYEHMQPALETIVAAVKQVVDWFARLPAGVQQVIVIIAALAAAIGPLLLVLGMFAASLGSIISLIGTFGPAIAGVAGPIGIAIAAIAGLVAAGVAIYKNWDEIKAKAVEIWEAIKEFFVTVVTSIGEFLLEKWNLISDNIISIWESIKEFFSNIWNNIKKFFSSTIGDILSNVIQKFKDIYNNIKNTMEDVFSKIKEIWDKIMDFFRDIDLVQIGKDMIQGLIDGIGSMAGALVDRAKGVVNDAITAAKNLLGIASPSRVFMEIGEDTGKGLEIGLRKMGARIKKASEDMVAHTIIEKELSLVGDARGALVGAGGGGDIIINIENMNVRNDDDINKLSRELQRSIGRARRGRGDGI